VEKVAELVVLPDGGGWNVNKINVEDILKIPVDRAGTYDYLAWNYT
jgi:hypothetical protein